MRDKLEGEALTGQSRVVTVKPAVPKLTAAKPKRKPETPTITDDLTGKFLRVGNKLYRTSDYKKPIVRLEPDRLTTSNIDALPDILRLAKANGWTSLRIEDGDKFKKAAYLAAAVQGLAVENYTPSKVVQAEADQLRGRQAEREARRANRINDASSPVTTADPDQRKVLAERFLSQTGEQNARDPELRRPQCLVAQSLSIARARYPDDPVKASKLVEAKRQQVAMRIANGDSIAAVQMRNQQSDRVREVSQSQALQRGDRSR
jgi:Large polyvalent protein-associated domain 7